LPECIRQQHATTAGRTCECNHNAQAPSSHVRLTKRSRREPGQANTGGAAAIHNAIHAVWRRQLRMNMLVRCRGETALSSSPNEGVSPSISCRSGPITHCSIVHDRSSFF